MDEETEKREETDLRELGAKWLERIKEAEKRDEKDGWTDEAERAEVAYTGKTKGKSSKGKAYDFNLMHSNVETIVPAIYNSTPTPDIRDRWGTDDVLAKSVSDVLERLIDCEIDDSRLDREIEKEAKDGFISGRGIIRLRFDAQVEETMMMVMDPATGESVETTETNISGEEISFEVVSWKDFRMGQAKREEDIPWMAFRHCIPEDDLEDITDEDMVAPQRKAEDVLGDSDDEVDVWEVWCRETKTVKFIRDDNSTIIKMEDDPLGLKSFFPVPGLFQPITIAGDLMPIVPFSIYRRLADEVEEITNRIHRITQGMKVRGLFIGQADDVMKLTSAGDNELVPVSGLEGLAQTGGLENAISWWPLDQAVQVLQQLYQGREIAKQEIYEVTGISDIVRGASKASETATAQQIKSEWGSLRIRRMQRMLERQVRKAFVMMCEIIANNYSVETIQAKTGLQVTPEMEELLRSPTQRYRIDVESDSTVRSDNERFKGELSEFLNGTATFWGTMAPILERAPTAAQPIMDLYAAFGRKFNIGQQGEAAIDELIRLAGEAAAQPQPNPEAERMKAEQQAEQAKMQMEQAKMQMEQTKAQAEQQAKQAEMQIKAQEARIKEMEAQGKMELDRERLEIEANIATAQIQKLRAEVAAILEGAKMNELKFASDEIRAAEARAESDLQPVS